MDGQLRALVVGGSVHWVDPIVGVLRRSGRRIEHQWAGTTEQLATALDRGRWDVVLSDYELDGREGLSSLELVRRADRDVPFILVADAIGEEEVAAAFRAGASDFVLTSRLDRLSTAVFRAIEERLARQRAAAELERSELSFRVLLD